MRLLVHSAVYGFGAIVSRVLNWLLTPLYVYVFQPEEYGIFSDLYALSFYPLIFLTFGMETTFFRFARHTLSEQQAFTNALTIVFGLCSTFLIFVFAFLPSIARALGYAQHPEWIALLALIIVLDVLAALPMAYLRYKEKPWHFVAISLTNVLITLGLNILFIGVWRLGITYVWIANLIASATRTLLAFLMHIPFSLEWAPKYWKPMVRYGAFIMLAGLLGAINESLDRVLLPRWWEDQNYFMGKPRTGLELNGIYAANYKIAMTIALFSQGFRYAVEPFFFKRHGEKTPKQMAQVFHLYSVFLLSVFFLIAGFRQELLSFTFWGLLPQGLLPPEYREGHYVIPILLLANVAFALYTYLSLWYKLSDRTQWGLYFAAIGATITIVVNWIGIPLWGYFACAVATLLCYLTMLVLSLIGAQRYYPIPYQKKWLFIPLFFFLSALFLMEWFGVFWKKVVVTLAVVVLAALFYRRFKKECLVL